MAVSRISAKNIVFKIGATSYAPEVNAVELSLNDAPGGIRTFSEVRANSEWKLKIDGFMSMTSTSLYRFLQTNFGTEVEFTINPAGSATEGTDTPSYKGTVIIDELPPLSLTSGEDAAFSVNLTVKNTGLDVAASLFYGLTIDTTP